MPVEIPDLWPASLQVDVLAPLPLLRAQGEKLADRTRGILEGEVQTIPLPDEKSVQHHFQVLAPALGIRYDILTVEHQREMPYPVKVGAACIPRLNPPQGTSWETDGTTEERRIVVPTEPLFRQLVQAVFSSTEVQSLLDSLIARSNEIQLPRGEVRGE